MSHVKEPLFLSIFMTYYMQTISHLLKCICWKLIVLFHHMDHHRTPSEHLCNIFMIGLLSAGATLFKQALQTQQSFWPLC